MRAKTSRSPSNAETAVYVRQAVEEAGSLRKAARRLGVSPAALGDIVRERQGHVSRSTENRVRAALGLAPVPARVEVDACPDCGGVHVGRCHGRAVEVRPARRPKPVTRIADMSIAQLRATIANRSEYP